MARIRSVRELSDSRRGVRVRVREKIVRAREKKTPSVCPLEEKEKKKKRTVEETEETFFPSRSSRSVFQPIAPLKTRRGPTRTSSPSASTSSRSGYISSNTTSVSVLSGCIFPNRSSYASASASASFRFRSRASAALVCKFRSYRRRNGSTRSAVGQGSQFGGNTKPLETSRQIVSFVSTRFLTSSATKTPRSLILRTFRAASTTALVGKTSTSLMLSSGTPRTIHGVSAPSRSSAENGTRVATQGPSQ